MAQERAFSGTREGSDGLATAKGQTTEIELSRAQQTIARRMAESKATIPHLALQCDIDMQECAALRDQLQTRAADRRIRDDTGPATARAENADAIPTYDAMLVKACALALREHRRINSSYRDGRLQLHSRVNVGVTLWAGPDDTGGGAPVTPTVFDADLKSLGEIAREIRALAARARGGSIAPPGARRRHVHGRKPRRVRRQLVHRDRQSTAGGDSRGGHGRAAPGGACSARGFGHPERGCARGDRGCRR